MLLAERVDLEIQTCSIDLLLAGERVHAALGVLLGLIDLALGNTLERSAPVLVLTGVLLHRVLLGREDQEENEDHSEHDGQDVQDELGADGDGIEDGDLEFAADKVEVASLLCVLGFVSITASGS